MMDEKRYDHLISPIARAIHPYAAGEQPQDKRYIKLNTNENPYPPSPMVTEAIMRRAGEALKLYPPLEIQSFRDAAAKTHGVASNMVFPGNGSDEVLAMAFMAFFDPGKPLLMPAFGYSFYPVYAQLYGLDAVRIPMNPDWSVPLTPFLEQRGSVVIANPNAPTSVALPLESLIRILKAHPDDIVLIDEAYADFNGETMIQYIDQYPNLCIVRTLSKSHSLAGLRAGYAVAQPHLIDALEKIRHSFNSYPVDTLAQAGASAALLDSEYAYANCRKIIATRDRFIRGLRILGFEVPDSKTNFAFAAHPKVEGKKIFEALRERGILVRRFDSPGIDNYLRISIGSDPDMDIVLARIREILE